MLPGLAIVARLDGRGFTRLTKEVHRFAVPFDLRCRDLMVATAGHLMDCGMRIVYGYTQSDEISLLFHPADDSFGRKERKLNSVLAGEASAAFALRLGAHGVFDCRICQLPDRQRVLDYFRWRQEDAHRNSIGAHAYWELRGDGIDPRGAAARLSGLDVAGLNEFLFQRGINVNDLSTWQKRGVGLRWAYAEKSGRDPRSGAAVSALRRTLVVDHELPLRDDYAVYLDTILDEADQKTGNGSSGPSYA